MEVSESALQPDQIKDRHIDDAISAYIDKAIASEIRRLKFLGAVLAAIGITGAISIAKYLVDTSVQTQIEKQTGNINQKMDLLTFGTLVDKVDRGIGFTPDDEQVIMSYLRKYQGVNSVRSSQEFAALLATIAKNFAAAERDPLIEEIFDTYRTEVMSNPAVIEAFIHHYGQHYASLPEGPIKASYEEKFRSLERAAEFAGSPELPKSYLVLSCINEDDRISDDETGRESACLVPLFKFVSELPSTGDQIRFMQEIIVRSDANNWMRSPNPLGYSLQRKVDNLFERHGETLMRLTGVQDSLIVQMSKSCCSNMESARDESRKIAEYWMGPRAR